MTVLKWAVEQMGASGATALILVSDVVTGAGVRWAHLRQAGVAPEEFSAFSRAALEIVRNRLSYVIKPAVDSSKYGSLVGLCKSIASSEGYQSYGDYETSRDKTRGMNARSRMIQGFVRKNLQNQARVAMGPTALLREWYNMRTVTNADGSVTAIAIAGDAGDGQPDEYTAATPDELLAMIPLSVEDRALMTVCQAILACGQQEPWPLIAEGQNPSPYRDVPQDIIDAAEVLGYTYQPLPDNYQPPAIVEKNIARPVFDLGCVGRPAIPDPRGPYHRRGPGPGGDDDDDEGGDDRPGHGANEVKIIIAPETYRQVLLGEADLRQIYIDQGGRIGPAPAVQVLVNPPGLNIPQGRAPAQSIPSGQNREADMGIEGVHSLMQLPAGTSGTNPYISAPSGPGAGVQRTYADPPQTGPLPPGTPRGTSEYGPTSIDCVGAIDT